MVFWFLKPLLMMRALPYVRAGWVLVGKKRRASIMGRVNGKYLLAGAAGLSGYVGYETYNSRQEVPGTGRIRYLMVDENDSAEVLKMAHDMIVDSMKECPPVDDLSSAVRRVKRIVMHLTNSCEELRHVEGGWKIHVILDDVPNAFATPGGHICVNTGLLKIVNNDELAMVLGHELSHVYLSHTLERIGMAGFKELGSTSFYFVMSYFLPDVFGVMRWEFLHRAVLPYFVDMPYSRVHELEADWLGSKFAARAGYDSVKGAIGFFRKNQDPTLQWMSTHPSDETRIDQIKSMSDELYKIRAEALQKPLKQRWNEWWAVEQNIAKERATLTWQRKGEIPSWVGKWAHCQLHEVSRSIYRNLHPRQYGRQYQSHFQAAMRQHEDVQLTIMSAILNVQNTLLGVPTTAA